MHSKSLQSCLALCDPMDCRPPGSSVQGILQARILEWVALPSSRGSSRPRGRSWVSCTANRFFTIWATRETLMSWSYSPSPQSAFSWGHIRSISDTLKQTVGVFLPYLQMPTCPFHSLQGWRGFMESGIRWTFLACRSPISQVLFHISEAIIKS